MRVLGIDPGTTRLGYAVVAGTRYAPEIVQSGVLGNPRLLRAARLRAIYAGLCRLIRDEKPDFVALEALFFAKNVKTAMSVAEARGVILLTAENANLKVYEYTPQQIKIALTGNGGAPKQQVAAMIRSILKRNMRPRWDDESDAVAVAITGLVSARDA